MLVYWDSVSIMDRWTLSEYFVVLLIVMSDTVKVLTQDNARNTTQHRYQRETPLAPPVDEYGNALCAPYPGATFCEEVDSYPDAEIRGVIPYSSEEFKELFKTPKINPQEFQGNVPVCAQQTRAFYPKAAMNENNQWAFIVNNADYEQQVSAEICEKDGQPCPIQEALPPDHTSNCRQRYAFIKMLALNPNQKSTYTDNFRFPSCCVCTVIKPFSLTSS